MLFGPKTPPSDDTLPLHTRVGGASAPSTWKRAFLVFSYIILLSLGLYTTPLWSYLPSVRLISIKRNPAYLIVADYGAVAADSGRCSNIGVDVLKDGGNAIDAAISAGLCVGVVNMFSSGIGGGGFMTVRIPTQDVGGSSEVFAVDFRETAPAGASATMFVHDPMAAKYGGLSVAVPSEIRGYEEAHSRWGRLPWRRLVEPSAELAAGWTVDVELARRIQMFPDLMLRDKDWSAVFAPEGKLLVQGEMIRRTNYSRTLDMIANGGPGAFYKGSIADSIIRKVNKTGGILTHADLGKYTVKIERALQGTYHDKKVYTSHAPTSGPVLLFMLNLLERFDLMGEGRTPLNVHRMVEAMKFGFAARTRMGDLAYYSGNVSRVLEISTKEFADLIAVNLTDDRTHPPEYYNPEFDVEIDDGTTHISVVDKDGMAVSLTSSVNTPFASRVLDPETGVILNNQMNDFSTPSTSNDWGLRSSPYNYPEPGKRPLSSTVPTILENADGSLYLVIGGSGGSKIFTSVFQSLLNVVEWDMDPSEGIEYGRVHDQLYPEEVDADNVLPAAVFDELQNRGHNVQVLDVNRIAAVVQIVMSKDGKLYAASDSRKNGIAAGY